MGTGPCDKKFLATWFLSWGDLGGEWGWKPRTSSNNEASPGLIQEG